MLLPSIIILLAFQPFNTQTISGKITDDNGNPLSAVSVVVKGTNVAAQSAQDGSYKINVTNKDATLVYSAVGYTTQKVKIKGRDTIDVVLICYSYKHYL